jgi:hypothetical protein
MEEKKMKRNTLSLLFVLTLLLALAVPVFAAPNDNMVLTGNVLAKGTFVLIQSKSLNGTTLQAGQYEVVASDTQVSFLLKHKIVAQAPIQWKDVVLTGENAVVDESGNIREIQFKGKKRSVVVE